MAYPPEIDDEIRRLRKTGLTHREIALRVGCSRWTVGRVVRGRQRVRTRRYRGPAHNARPVEEKLAARERHLAGESYRDIAAHYGISLWRVAEWCRQFVFYNGDWLYWLGSPPAEWIRRRQAEIEGGPTPEEIAQRAADCRAQPSGETSTGQGADDRNAVWCPECRAWVYPPCVACRARAYQVNRAGAQRRGA